MDELLAQFAAAAGLASFQGFFAWVPDELAFEGAETPT
jgi:hypothetical protein